MRLRIFRWGDLLILALVALLALGAVAAGVSSRASEGPVKAQVYQGGKLVRMIDLSTVTEPETFELDGAYHDFITVEPGRIRFVDADCPDKTCVHTGWIHEAGQIAACVPNRVMIKLVGQSISEEDTVVR